MNWINAKDRLPEDGQEVVAYFIIPLCPLLNTPFLSIATFHKGHDGYFTMDKIDGNVQCVNTIIYWLPLEDLDIERLYPFEKDWCC